jgi:hypothetical protein
VFTFADDNKPSDDEKNTFFALFDPLSEVAGSCTTLFTSI